MKEVEWLAGTDPWKMLCGIGWKGSERKFRLIGVACCRSLWDLAGDDRTRKAIEVAELYADGQIDDKEAQAAGQFMMDDTPVNFFDHLSSNQAALLCSAGRMCLPNEVKENLNGLLNNLKWRDAVNAGFLREILGNPFQPVSINPAWQTPTVLTLAQTAYDNRDLPAGTLQLDRLAVLADALEEAGCDSEEILNHLRNSRPHMRGCWSIDRLLNRE